MPSLTGSEIALGRARSDIDVMSRAGLPLHRFMEEAAAAIESVIPIDGGCLSTLDPATAMVSSTRKFAGLAGNNAGDVAWAHVEYGVEDPSSIESMVRAGTTALGMHASLDGAVESSTRMAELMLPVFDYRDEARAIFHDRHGAWGAISVFRGPDTAPFSSQELAFLEAIAPAFTRGIRAGLLSQLSAADADRAGDVVVTIEEARPQEVMGLVADAFGFTARERDVTTQVLRGADTKEIAAAMHVSPYTVQDHLKSIFDKAGVASRRELVSRVYFDQYVPRWGSEVTPGGFLAA